MAQPYRPLPRPAVAVKAAARNRNSTTNDGPSRRPDASYARIPLVEVYRILASGAHPRATRCRRRCSRADAVLGQAGSHAVLQVNYDKSRFTKRFHRIKPPRKPRIADGQFRKSVGGHQTPYNSDRDRPSGKLKRSCLFLSQASFRDGCDEVTISPMVKLSGGGQSSRLRIRLEPFSQSLSVTGEVFRHDDDVL